MLLLRTASLVFAFLFLVGCGSTPSTPSGSNKPGDGDKKPPSGKVDFSLTAVDLAKEFETDKKAAEAKYKGKNLELEAEADSPTDRVTDVTMAIGIYKADPKKALGRLVVISFNASDTGKVFQLTPGQKIKVRATCFGEFGGSVSLINGVLLEAGPDPALSVKAPELTKAFTDNQEMAQKTYDNKWVLIEGVLLETRKSQFGNDVVIFEGHDEKAEQPVRVKATIVPDLNKTVKDLKKGAVIKVKGQLSGFYPPEKNDKGHFVNINSAWLIK